MHQQRMAGPQHIPQGAGVMQPNQQMPGPLVVMQPGQMMPGSHPGMIRGHIQPNQVSERNYLIIAM